jgi:uncharacterized protein YqgC (DUF456 family)
VDALTILYAVLAIVLVIGGLVGAIYPMLPGPPMVFAGLWLGAYADQYQHAGFKTLVLIGVLGGIAVLLDFVAASFGAKRVGASPMAITGATLGTLVGLFFGIPGLLFGPFLGAMAGELYAQQSLHQATRSGLGTWLGLFLGTIAKLALSFMMIGVFAFAWLFA